jgi:hypothetical protein
MDGAAMTSPNVHTTVARISIATGVGPVYSRWPRPSAAMPAAIGTPIGSRCVHFDSSTSNVITIAPLMVSSVANTRSSCPVPLTKSGSAAELWM